MSLKRQKLDSSGYFHQQSNACVEASFEVALQITKQKKPHTIGETLTKPCALSMVKLILGETSAQKIQQVSLSNAVILKLFASAAHFATFPNFAAHLDQSADLFCSCTEFSIFFLPDAL